MPLYVLSLLVGYVALTLASVCTSSPYAALSCLTVQAKISEYCSSFAGPGYSDPSTIWATSTSTSINTTVVAASTPSALMTSTGTTITTVTIKPAAESTAYEATYITAATQTTLTVYTSPSVATSTSSSATAVSERIRYAHGRGEAGRHHQRDTCYEDSASDMFSSLSPDQLATACSCLGVEGVTTTVLSTVVASSTTTLTLASDVPVALETGVVHLTAEAATTNYLPITTSVTRTHTVYAAAPSYTHVWGPRAGCQNIVESGVQQLNQSVTQQAEAVSQCQTGCTSRSDRDVVQQSLTNACRYHMV